MISRRIRQLLVISGKGGTGKTSVTAGMAVLAEDFVLADADVDASDLPIVFQPSVEHSEPFSDGRVARVQTVRCSGCGACVQACRFDGLSLSAPLARAQVDDLSCEGCGLCQLVCPAGAITLDPVVNGHWYRSSTRVGPMVHARLSPGGENSGKLVTLVRREAELQAERSGCRWILIDGPPGLGCPVIAAMTGVDLALVVTEPTCSGLSDLQRTLALANHFQVPAAICINKCDLNSEIANRIDALAVEHQVPVVGRIAYDSRFIEAQLSGLAVTELGGPVGRQVESVYHRVLDLLDLPKNVGRRHSEKTYDRAGVESAEKGKKMRIAVPVVEGQLCMHFGHCQAFAIVDIDDQQQITGQCQLDPPAHEPGLLPRWLAEEGVTVVIAGGMGQRAQQIFTQSGIKVVVGAPSESVESLVKAYLAGSLACGVNSCDH